MAVFGLEKDLASRESVANVCMPWTHTVGIGQMFSAWFLLYISPVN